MRTVYSICNQIRNKTAQGADFQSLLFNIRKEFRLRKFKIKILTRRKSFLDFDEYYVNAYYDSLNDENKEIPIEIIIFHNFDYAVKWDSEHITQLLIQIFDALVHEIRHQEQSKTRDHLICWHGYTYLEDPDEIDAYAMSIAIELCRSLGKYRALRYLSKITLLSKLRIRGNLVSPNLYAYLLDFPLSHKITKTLAKKVYLRLQKIDSSIIFM